MAADSGSRSPVGAVVEADTTGSYSVMLLNLSMPIVQPRRVADDRRGKPIASVQRITGRSYGRGEHHLILRGDATQRVNTQRRPTRPATPSTSVRRPPGVVAMATPAHRRPSRGRWRSSKRRTGRGSTCNLYEARRCPAVHSRGNQRVRTWTRPPAVLGSSSSARHAARRDHGVYSMPTSPTGTLSSDTIPDTGAPGPAGAGTGSRSAGPAEPPRRELRGVVERITCQNPENGLWDGKKPRRQRSRSLGMLQGCWNCSGWYSAPYVWRAAPGTRFFSRISCSGSSWRCCYEPSGRG